MHFYITKYTIKPEISIRENLHIISSVQNESVFKIATTTKYFVKINIIIIIYEVENVPPMHRRVKEMSGSHDAVTYIA